MIRNRLEMRRLVLRSLIEHREANYDLEFPFEESFRYSLSAHQIDALIAFKGDDHLLHEEPSRPVCGDCEERLRAVHTIR